MTGFARWQDQDALGAFSWELRSVNHRFLEPAFRLPEEFRGLEPELRERMGKHLKRGKIECQLKYQRPSTGSAGLRLDEDVLDQLRQQLEVVNGRQEGLAAPTSLDVLRWPGVVCEAAADLEPLQARALEGFDDAVRSLVSSRESEGGRVSEMLSTRCDKVLELIVEVRGDLPKIRAAMRERLQGRLAEIDANPDPGRLEQELIFHLNRMDVDEELDRLGSHVEEVRDVLERDEPAGRRLDFLMQEFNREANTLASKAQAASTTGAAVELKVVIEQMREQVQNVE